MFSKSLIFRDDHELKAKTASTNSLDELETKSEPDYLSDRPNRTKVYFEDEINSPVTDFEIMFKDELLATNMFKIDEEDTEDSDRQSQDTEEGLTMNVAVKKQDIIKPSTITIKDETKITTVSPIYKYDPVSSMALPSAFSLPRVESVKGILRIRSDNEFPRSNSSKTLDRVDSSGKLSRPMLSRVDSLKNMDPTKFNKVLSRVPHRSASFLNIPEHLAPVKPPLIKSKSMVGVMSATEELKLSQLPDTPIIKSTNLPRFFADCPSLPEYKGETSLQSIKQQSAMLYQEDFSMPRYYRTVSKSTEQLPVVHESKSMPDLRNPTTSSGKVSKRLVKLRSKLKPLVIKKNSNEKL